MATGNHLEVAVAAFKAIGIVEDLNIIFIALGVVYRIFVFPVVMVLVEGNGADAARGEIERRVAEVVVGTDCRL